MRSGHYLHSLTHPPSRKASMIMQYPTPRPGAAPSDLSEPTDRDSRDSDPRDTARPGEGDPFRQLFHRHANHMNSAQIGGLQARLRRRLFADRELG